jgi:hypothetical protein
MTSEPSRPKTRSPQHRLSIILALAVFFLPLHFHVTSAIASQVTKECSCLHGTRTQLGMAAEVSPPTLLVEITFVIPEKELGGNKIWSDPEKVRGPPIFTSL